MHASTAQSYEKLYGSVNSNIKCHYWPIEELEVAYFSRY